MRHLFRLEFVEYWQRITAIDKVTEFQKHHCSEELKIFLEVNQNMKNSVSECMQLSHAVSVIDILCIASNSSGRSAHRE